MDIITRLTQGRHCTWWAEKPMDSPSPSKQQILRGFPAQGIPFPKEEDIPWCDVCPHPKPIRRGPLPGWLSYGTDRRKTPSPDPRKGEGTQKKVNNDCDGLRAMAKVPTRKKGKKKNEEDKKDEYVRHDGHFKLPEHKKVVTFVKQYQRRDVDPQPAQQSDKMMDYGADNDIKMLAVPTCGVNCYQIRQNVFRAVDELMSKQPEVVRIRPRVRPKDLPELQKLETQEATSQGTQVGNSLEESIPIRNAVAVTSGKQKTEASTQTQSPPSSVAEASSSGARPAAQFETKTLMAPPRAATPSLASLLMEVPAFPDIHALEAPPDAQLQNGPQPKITTLLFAQPRVATPISEDQSSTSKDQKTEWKEVPKYLLPRYKETISAPIESSSSLENRVQNYRERQREKHWEREMLNSAIMYQDLPAKAKAIDRPGRGPSNLVGERGEGISAHQTGEDATGEKSQKKDVPHDPDGQEVEVKLSLNNILGRLNLGVDASGEQAQTLEDRFLFGGLDELLKSAEEFGRRDVTDSRGEQQLPISSSSIPATELEHMKAAIFNHKFYPRLVCSFIEQHAAGAPPETVAKLERVRRRVLQRWNPNNSPECDEKIRKYQEILTKFESELERPFQEAMDLSFRLENMLKSPLSGHNRNHDSREEEETMFS